ncbi:MAG TPA: Gfo/Idh/MocA family oxidoreductase [Mycobacteriales bacterium]|nr:Gfo/Idh/MocA family oxidoreductase [Mycobacteriales bacterium]
MQNLRVGLIGCGSAGTGHAMRMAAMPGIDLVALADPSEQNLQHMREQVPATAGLPSFADAAPMYDAIELDAVSVIAPHTLHFPIVMAAIEHGKHVLCEKPLTCEAEQARTIEKAAEAAGLTVMVSYQRRFDPAYRYMRNAIESGALGEIRSIAVSCGQRWKTGTAGKWRQDPALSGGGMLMDSGSHLADMLLWLAGRPIEKVFALVDNVGAPVDINTAATVSFAGGVQGQLTVIGDLATTWVETATISGSEGLLRYETEPQHPWRTGRLSHYRRDGIEVPLTLRDDDSPYQGWLAAIRGEAPNPAPPAAGIQVALLSEAIYRSAKEGAAVTP